jgi:hypothetical protein
MLRFLTSVRSSGNWRNRRRLRVRREREGFMEFGEEC